MVDVDGSSLAAELTGQVGRHGLRVGGHLALSLYSSNEPGELSLLPRHDDSTINTVISISIGRMIVVRWTWQTVARSALLS